MKIINPLNRIPATEETMVMACHCVCNSGSATAKAAGSTHSSGCGCNCISGNIANRSANGTSASNY